MELSLDILILLLSCARSTKRGRYQFFIPLNEDLHVSSRLMNFQLRLEHGESLRRCVIDFRNDVSNTNA